MDGTAVSKPQPTLQPPPRCNDTEFDPCSNAKPSSPFYLYNHDSPRPSGEYKPKPSFHASIRDLETGSEVLTPSVTQEKMDNIKQTKTNKSGLWLTKSSSKRCQDMCKPKGKGWLKRMPRKQRMIIKLLIALFIIGCMVGISVGIAVGVRSSVWKGNNQQSNIN